jgi:alpha-ketoglutarate-dependent taurine dioxygenase
MDTVVEPAGRFSTKDLTPRIGTEIEIDRHALLSGTHAKEIRGLLEKRGVLVFRNAHLDDEQQTVFTKTLGETALQLGKEVMSIAMDKSVNNPRSAEYQRGTIYWHIDLMNTPLPSLASILTPRKLSEEGGDTEFANTYAAWEDLPEDEKREYAGLRVIHALEASQVMTSPEPSVAQLEQWRVQPKAEQPLVWTHRSGRKSLVLGASAHYVVGKSPEESRFILTKLRDWATQRQFVYRHKWQMGDVLIWDNTGTMHRVQPYPMDSGRHMRRTALKGEEPVA